MTGRKLAAQTVTEMSSQFEAMNVWVHRKLNKISAAIADLSRLRRSLTMLFSIGGNIGNNLASMTKQLNLQ